MRIEENFDLTNYNSYKLTARCKRAYFPNIEEDFLELYSNDKITSKIILGGGYNIILSKRNYEEDFILIGESFSKTIVNTNVIEAEAGVNLKDLSEIALSHNLSGLEVFYDIPSSLGGAVVMNAGASGEEMKDILIKARYLDLEDLKIKELNAEDIGFEYRNSFFQKHTNKIVLKAWLQLKPGSPAEIRHKMETIKNARWAKQPKEYPNAGSVFKRPKGKFVGPMLDELGLKGFSIGGAKVSEKHSGFIVNFNQATGTDILEVISAIQKKVKEKFAVDLEVEQRII